MSSSGSNEAPGARAAGCLFVVSAPSGTGKTSLVRGLVDADPDIVLSVSHTTRKRREGERDGVHYHFVSDEEFQSMVAAGEFLEHARVFDHCYGTSRAAAQSELGVGRDVVLEIDWQGARQVRAKVDATIGVFILPPSIETLRERLRLRGQDSEEVIERRMRDAVREMSHYDEFDYLVVNDDFETALAELRAVVSCQRLRLDRQLARHPDLIASILA